MTPEERAARERKQKIFVVIGGLLLLGLLAIQLPKLIGGSSSPEAAATTTETSPATGQPVAAGAPVAVVATSTETGKITSFSVFEAKDPFVQQVVTENGTETTAQAEAAKGAGGAGAGSTAQKPTKFSTGRTTVAAVTIVTVNGARQVLEPGMRFPASDPLFVLVAEKPGAKAVVVGIAGGAYSGGDRTTTLKVGKPLTLVNTATGARYKISLVSVGSGGAAEQAEPAP